MCNDDDTIFSSSCLISSSIFDVDIGSRADVGSAIRRISGLIEIALAIHNLCVDLQKVQVMIYEVYL